jgi:hypothetical protein
MRHLRRQSRGGARSGPVICGKGKRCPPSSSSRPGEVLTVWSAADVFLGSLGNSDTARNYGIGVGKTAERLGGDRPFASGADGEVGESLGQLSGTTAVKHLEPPPGGGALLAGLERGARLRWAGGPGLGESGWPHRTRRPGPARS